MRKHWEKGSPNSRWTTNLSINPENRTVRISDGGGSSSCSFYDFQEGERWQHITSEFGKSVLIEALSTVKSLCTVIPAEIDSKDAEAVQIWRNELQMSYQKNPILIFKDFRLAQNKTVWEVDGSGYNHRVEIVDNQLIVRFKSDRFSESTDRFILREFYEGEGWGNISKYHGGQGISEMLHTIKILLLL